MMVEIPFHLKSMLQHDVECGAVHHTSAQLRNAEGGTFIKKAPMAFSSTQPKSSRETRF
jgi:hypothetical protein